MDTDSTVSPTRLKQLLKMQKRMNITVRSQAEAPRTPTGLISQPAHDSIKNKIINK